MCNEKETSAWFIHGAGIANKSPGFVENDKEGKILTIDDNTGVLSTTVSSVYSKDDHATSGVNRKFEATLVDTIDEVYRSNWNLPEYLPFRECIKMSIQDGIEAGMKRAAAGYDKKIAEKDKVIQDLTAEAERWKNVFTELVKKCRAGIDALDFISRVVHGSSGKQY
jgi:hypothetical protein